MTLLDISGASFSGEVFHVLATAFKLAVGSLGIISLAFFAFIGVVIYSFYDGYKRQSILEGARTLIHFTAYAIGASVALLFALVAGMFFSIAAAKLLFITLLVGFAVAFVVRETFLFLVLKRFGKYLMYFTALRYIKERVYQNGQQENQP